MTLEARFWSKVDAGGDCWLWTAYTDDDGYGRFQVAGAVERAHRYAWQIMVGPIPDHLELDHLCRVPACVNPDHLEAVTHAENMRRGKRQRAAVCSRGHNDWYTNPSGQRQCRPCYNAWRRSWRATR